MPITEPNDNSKKTGSKIRLAVFDLDGTLYPGNSLHQALIARYARSFWMPYVFVSAVMRRLRWISLEQFKRRVLIGFRGNRRKEILQWGERFAQRTLIPAIPPAGIGAIRRYKESGATTLLLSGSPEIYLEALRTHLEMDMASGTRLEYADGCFTGRFDGGDCLGDVKRIRLGAIANELGVTSDEIVVFSDHHSDIELMSRCGKAVAIDPTPELEREAIRRGWLIERWSSS